jgi:hypothetical protein
MVVFLYKRRPDLLVKMGVVKKKDMAKTTSGKGSVMGIVLLLLVLCCFPFTPASAAEKWQGVDESVVEKVAKEHGREAHKPLINTDQGDLLLFVFLLAGVAGGFVAGYNWKNLMNPGIGQQEGQDRAKK